MADTKVDEAKDALRRHFVDKRKRPVKTPYFHHQLQVLYEADFLSGWSLPPCANWSMRANL